MLFQASLSKQLNKKHIKEQNERCLFKHRFYYFTTCYVGMREKQNIPEYASVEDVVISYSINIMEGNYITVVNTKER
ncbi:Uncharacterised protein [Mycobacteroides abscessus subsp. abscessus]|nr:Uncharacterised protein [Mycobacteroides abscessus subsp. abscessus]